MYRPSLGSLASPEYELKRLESNIDIPAYQVPPPSGFDQSPTTK